MVQWFERVNGDRGIERLQVRDPLMLLQNLVMFIHSWRIGCNYRRLGQNTGASEPATIGSARNGRNRVKSGVRTQSLTTTLHVMITYLCPHSTLTAALVTTLAPSARLLKLSAFDRDVVTCNHGNAGTTRMW